VNIVIGTMVEVNLGEDVRSVRSKLGMADSDYHAAWRTVNVSRLPTLPIPY